MTRLAEGAPISTDIVGEAADSHAVSATELSEALATIHDDLVDGADAIHEHYVGGNGERSAPLVANGGLVEVIDVDSGTWTRMAERLGLSDAVGAAARSAHADYARRLGADERALAERDALVMPAHVLSGLTRAGLSPRQSEVQVLRMRGETQEEIGDRLGMEVGTVKSHCHRIDRKIDEARRLLGLVGE
ncbi:sigma factor-like helix-turn-helix DNA-binding protein [Haladaptatus salinisoli]|uniref:sigma factor-like helix-turn-helix DNA-binding protein n=1 Tax=Haladaptatus salinisoli TaxID=2884876 RepID=UPI001D0A165E|nr:sigma factor-like helix-turn-helix DNA-binding protein [Haladaptatus salinisoli]